MTCNWGTFGCFRGLGTLWASQPFRPNSEAALNIRALNKSGPYINHYTWIVLFLHLSAWYVVDL